MIKFRKERRVRDDMVDLGIAFANPSVELGAKHTTKEHTQIGKNMFDTKGSIVRSLYQQMT